MNSTKERPILFNGEMVRAVLDGRKTQTRRVVKHDIPEGHIPDPCHYSRTGWAIAELKNGVPWECQCRNEITCPYGVPGDRLWVRETWLPLEPDHIIDSQKFVYRADCDDESERCRQDYIRCGYDYKWRPSIHMPRWASRITLEITDVRVERLQDLSENDAIAEGVELVSGWIGHKGEPCRVFCKLWESINGEGSWAANPWVWVVEFRRVQD